MAKGFERDGIRFDVPRGWAVEIEDDQDGVSWTASVQGPGTAFLVASYVHDIDDPTVLVDAALEGLRADYPDLEAEDAVETIAGQPSVGMDVNFVHLDLTNTCWIRVLTVAGGALLLMAQCTDDELDDQGAVLKRILGSIVTED